MTKKNDTKTETKKANSGEAEEKGLIVTETNEAGVAVDGTVPLPGADIKAALPGDTVAGHAPESEIIPQPLLDRAPKVASRDNETEVNEEKANVLHADGVLPVVQGTAFVPADLSTVEGNQMEAMKYVDMSTKNATKSGGSKRTSKKGDVVYRSRNAEAGAYAIMGVRPTRSVEYPGHLEWRVPSDIADRFEKHYHVTHGRIVKV